MPCIFISPPTAMFPFPSLKGLNVWAAVGDCDQFCDREGLYGVLDRERVTVMEETDHFWFGDEERLKRYITKKLDLIRSISY